MAETAQARHVRFKRHLQRNGTIAGGMLVAVLAIGMIGYAIFDRQGLIDSFFSASMIVSGMGPTSTPASDGGKLFSGVYAIFAGLMFVAISGLMLGPFLHRILRNFNISDRDVGSG